MKKNLYITPAVRVHKVTISSVMLEGSPASTHITNDGEITTPEGMNSKHSTPDSDWDEI